MPKKSDCACCASPANGNNCRIDGPTGPESCRFILEGLSCASCADKIESAVQELPDVRLAQLNFTTGSLALDSALPCQDLLGGIAEIVERIEPGVSVRPWQKTGQKKISKHIKAQLWRLSGGALLLIMAQLTVPYVPGELTVAIYLASYFIAGGSVLLAAASTLRRGGWFDEHLLMSIATVGAIVLGEYPEAIAVMLFYLLGEIIQGRAVDHSRREIAALLDIRPDNANVLEGHQVRNTDPERVEVGQMILIRPGERVPLDGILVEGESLLDSSALTGESRPRRQLVGDEILAGMISLTGSLTLRVVRKFEQSTLARVIELVENATENKAVTEQFITRFAKVYTPIVVLAAFLLAVIPPIFVGSWSEWLYRALIFLVISCPCALVISIPLGFFGGIGRASKQGILIKGGNYLEALAQVDTVVFDKTGTLTQGQFEVQEILPGDSFNSTELLEIAALAEIDSNHPIAQSIRRKYAKHLSRKRIDKYIEHTGLGISITIDSHPVLVGNRLFLTQQGIACPELRKSGVTVCIAVAGSYAGALIIADKLRADAAAAIAALRRLGVRRIEMLSGDRREEAALIAEQLQLDDWQAELLPEGKLLALEKIISRVQTGKLIMVGDGINDAPVLARADVGVAMGAMGSEAAIEAADVVLMTDEPGKLVTAIETARLTRRIVWQNIGLAFGFKAVVMGLGVFGLATIWQAIFADVGVAVVAVLNAARIIRI